MNAHDVLSLEEQEVVKLKGVLLLVSLERYFSIFMR